MTITITMAIHMVAIAITISSISSSMHGSRHGVGLRQAVSHVDVLPETLYRGIYVHIDRYAYTYT
jgi:hypothetical protein